MAAPDPSNQPEKGEANRLSGEKSPYLLQHARNPVQWHPWGQEAFAQARNADKPIFLSIGYSTCHWCHVMAHESFEDPSVAEVLNRVFVSIKVDREERPDIDDAYMTACQAMTGSGGWPLSIFMTPDRLPFFAATYLPPRSRHGRLGLIELSERIDGLWRTSREKLLAVGAGVLQDLSPSQDAPGRLDRSILDVAFRELSRRFDERFGGFGAAPKFPSPHVLMFLLRYWRRRGRPDALWMVERTLTAMRHGGIFDHVGFGFHRYSTDERWMVPHFEKMLYDQALLSMAYTEAFQATGTGLFAATTRQVADYVLRDLLLPQGAFASAEDADIEGAEGRFYLWTQDEIRAAVGDEDARLVAAVFGVRPEGNIDVDQHGAFGLNVLHLGRPIADAASALGIPPAQAAARMDRARARLLKARNARPRPFRDDKILTDWNGLMIAALAKASAALDEPRYALAARRAADFLLHTLRTEDGRLLHRFRGNEAAIEGYATDYAFLAWGLLELYEASFEAAYVVAAAEIAEEMTRRFGDSGGGLFLTAEGAESVLVRSKDIYDGAAPSANSVALHVMVRLSRITGNAEWEHRAETLAEAFAQQVTRAPTAHTHFLSGFDHLANPSTEIAIAGRAGADDTLRLMRALTRRFLPATVIVLNPKDPPDPLILGLVPELDRKGPVDGSAAAYVCRDRTCHPPVTTEEDLVRLVIQEDRIDA